MIEIVPLAQVLPEAVAMLLDAAFGADRKTRTAYRLRVGVTAIPLLSFAAFDRGQLLGTLQSWPVRIEDYPLTLVGPVAVLPERQRSGVGRRLMTALDTAAGDAPLTMIGDPEYYGRFFGFSADATAGWDLPGPVERTRLLARNVPGGLVGKLGPDAKRLAA